MLELHEGTSFASIFEIELLYVASKEMWKFSKLYNYMFDSKTTRSPKIEFRGPMFYNLRLKSPFLQN